MATKSKREKLSWDAQVLFCVLAIDTFFGCAIIRCFSQENYARRWYNYFIMLALLFVTIFLLSRVAILHRLRKQRTTTGTVRSFPAKNIDVLFLWILTILPRIRMLATLPKWDAGEYYSTLISACENFNLTMSGFMRHFSLAGHMSYGYAPVMAIGEYLFPKSVYGVTGVNLFLMLICVYFVYRMIMEISESRISAFLSALVFSLSPMILGTGGYIHLDYGVFIFTVFVVYFAYRQEWILLFVSGLILSMSKETGVIVFAGFMCPIILFSLFRKDWSWRKRVKQLLFGPHTLISFITGSIFILMYQLKPTGLWGSTTQKPTGHSREDMIEFVQTKLFHIFCLNFNWLVTFLLLIGFVLLLIYGRRMKWRYREFQSYLGMWGALLAFCTFSCLFYTSILPRYNLVSDALLLLILVMTVAKFRISRKRIASMFYFGLPVLCVLFLMESYLTVDPVTKSQMQRLNTGGKYDMIYGKAYKGDTLFGDYMVYNYQYTFFDRGIDWILSDIHFAEGWTLLFPKQADSIQLSGNGKYYQLYWNPFERKRVFHKTADTMVLSASGMYSLRYKGTHPECSFNQKAVYIVMPYDKEDENKDLELLSKYYNIEEKRTYSELAGSMDYYILSLKSIKKYDDPIKGYEEEKNTCLVEFVNNDLFEEKTLKDGYYTINGWVYDTEQTNPYKTVYIKINGKYYAANQVKSAGIARRFKGKICDRSYFSAYNIPVSKKKQVDEASLIIANEQTKTYIEIPLPVNELNFTLKKYYFCANGKRMSTEELHKAKYRLHFVKDGIMNVIYDMFMHKEYLEHTTSNLAFVNRVCMDLALPVENYEKYIKRLNDGTMNREQVFLAIFFGKECTERMHREFRGKKLGNIEILTPLKKVEYKVIENEVTEDKSPQEKSSKKKSSKAKSKKNKSKKATSDKKSSKNKKSK
ncbi:MAG: hypothetical protein K6G65_09765 [Lachnospiraceae bacterium]|nr:hypothetical protein [Lachnospiraceae bacterium]